MNKNPFSFYDFLGYLFPGIIATIVFIRIYLVGILSDSISVYFDIKQIIQMLAQESELNFWLSAMCFIVISYIVGHLLAYSSSITVEYFATRFFEYPSVFLLNKITKTKWWSPFKDRNCLIIIIRSIIMVSLLPPFVISCLLYKCNFIQRPLEDCYSSDINKKIEKLAYNLNINEFNKINDYHRFVMHYVYLHYPECQRKTDNYIALYGFLRSICFLFSMIFLFMLITSLCSVDSKMSIDCNTIIWIIVFFVLSIIFYLAYLKFYRRFTLENLMTLLVCYNNLGFTNDLSRQ